MLVKKQNETQTSEKPYLIRMVTYGGELKRNGRVGIRVIFDMSLCVL